MSVASHEQPARSALHRATAARAECALAAACGVLIAVLAATTLADVSRTAQLPLVAVLVVCFAVLAVRQLVWAFGVVCFELALGGAGARWAEIGGSLSARNVLVAVLVLRAAWLIVARWRASGSLDLGRYGPHAIVAAILLPLIWMPMGLARGNTVSNVVGDGNAIVFLLLTLVVLQLLHEGHAATIRRLLLWACTATAVLTGVLAALAIAGALNLDTQLRPDLIGKLDMGGAVGLTAEKAHRLYLGSGLYLQIGLALLTWEVLERPRRAWPWLLMVLFWVDVLVTDTRGYLVGAVLAVGIVVLGAAPRPVVLLRIGVGAVVAVVVAVGVLGVLGEEPSSLDRLGIGNGGSNAPLVFTDDKGNPIKRPIATGDVSTNRASDAIRRVQARVLRRHIEARPVLGSGYGSIARDYPFGTDYSYELAYFDIAYKTGLVGLLIFLSFPLRLLLDAARARLRPRAFATVASPRAAAVPAAMVASMLALGATNPYLNASFGLFPIVMATAWLERPARDPA